MRLAVCSLGAILLLGVAPVFPASGRASSAVAAARQKQHSSDETFTGLISQNPDNRDIQDTFVFYDRADMTNYFIGGNQDLSRYVNKTVQVTGTSDRRNKTIRVKSIDVVNANS